MSIYPKKKLFLLLFVLAFGAVIYFLIFMEKDNQRATSSNTAIFPCLNDNRVANYKFEDEKAPLVNVIVSIYDKNTDKEILSFKIENVFKTSTSVELHQCGIYVIRFFDYDPKKSKQNLGYKDEFWRYDYSGRGEGLILLSEKPKEFISYYSLDFRVDPLEKYIALEKGYLGKEDYSLVIKNLKTKENAFVLSMKTVVEQYPNIVGYFGLREWTKDGRYFWGRIFEGANVNGFFRIDNLNWKTDIFEAPQDVLGGDALNIENGYITVHPGNVWFGFAELTEEEVARRRAQGIGTELYIHNLFTGKQQFVDKTDEPLWFFQPKWPSNTELQYTLPNGEKKVYKINQ